MNISFRTVSLVIIIGTMAIITQTSVLGGTLSVSPTLVLGFLILSSYIFGFLLEKLKIPRITSYIFSGLILGPYVLGFFSPKAIDDLSFINSLALAFIAFCAGGELHLSGLKSRLKSILFLIIGVTSVVFIGVTLSVFAISSYIPFMQEFDPKVRLAISFIFGVISVARSPSSTIAIISETKSKGPLTETILAVIVVTDVIIIMLFAGVISFSQMIIKSGESFNSIFILGLLGEIGIAFVLGYLLGRGIIFLIERVHLEFPVVMATMGFLVIKFSHLLSAYLHEVHQISISLEPLLICMMAGFTVQNFSKHGETFLERMDNVSLPIYIAFFAITGASIKLSTLKTGWIIGMIVLASRTIMLYISSYLSGKLSGDPPTIYKNTWLGFITQAGVSLGLLSEVVRRFPEVGIPIQSILVASITFNQVVGPIALKYALNKVGESNIKKGKK